MAQRVMSQSGLHRPAPRILHVCARSIDAVLRRIL
jgi:hypothetical protein